MFGVARMSDIIADLAQPIIDTTGETPEEVEQVIRCTLIGWNLTQFPAATREHEFVTLANKLLGPDYHAVGLLEAICAVVDAGKRAFYPDVNRTILSVRFEREPDDTVYFDVMHVETEDTR